MTNSIQKDVNIKVVLAWLFNLGNPGCVKKSL